MGKQRFEEQNDVEIIATGTPGVLKISKITQANKNFRKLPFWQLPIIEAIFNFHSTSTHQQIKVLSSSVIDMKLTANNILYPSKDIDRPSGPMHRSWAETKCFTEKPAPLFSFLKILTGSISSIS